MALQLQKELESQDDYTAKLEACSVSSPQDILGAGNKLAELCQPLCTAELSGLKRAASKLLGEKYCLVGCDEHSQYMEVAYG